MRVRVKVPGVALYTGSMPVEARLRSELDRHPAIRLVSFDVFDTVLTRMVGEPAALFLLLGESLRARGLLAGSPEQFARLRKEAERRARRFAPPPEDVTLAQIYGQLVHLWPALQSRLTTLIAAELEFEASYLHEVPGARGLLDLAAEAGRTVVFVSDMYLPHDFIRGQLERHGLATRDSRVYVSSAHCCSKSSGLLRHVLAEQQVAPEAALHVGDHPRADLAAARAAGMRGILVTHTRLNRFETLLENASFASGGTTSVFAGASRLCRLEMGGRQEPAAFGSVLAGVAGPALVTFVLWLFGVAQGSDIRRLYFLSGKGSVLHALARAVNDGLGLGFDLRALPLRAASAAAAQAELEQDRRLEQRMLDAAGFFDDVPMGLVDTDLWQSPLPYLHGLRRARGRGLEGFLCMRTQGAIHAELPRTRAFFYDADASRGDPMAASLRPLLEVFTAAGQGRITGYAESGGLVHPLFEPLSGAKAQSAARQLEVLCRFAAEAIAYPEALGIDEGAGVAANATLTAFWNAPSGEEATFWGASEVGGGSAELWPSLTLAEVWRSTIAPGRDTVAWSAGSLHRSARHVRVLIEAARVGRRWQARGRQLLRRAVRLSRRVLRRPQRPAVAGLVQAARPPGVLAREHGRQEAVKRTD